MRLSSAFAQHRILGGAMVLAAMQFGAALMGLVRDRVLAQTFPGLGIVDVYIAAFRPSDLLFQVVIVAGFSVAVVPILAQYKAKNDQLQMSGFLNGTVTVAAIGFGVLALITALVFPVLAPFMTQFEGESLVLYITFGRIALLTNFLFVFGNAFGQYLITIQRYWLYGLTPILYTLGTICGTVFLTPVFGPYGPMLGTLGGAILYVIIRLFAVFRAGYRPQWTLWHPDLPEMGRLMLPRMLALGALQLELLLFDTVASGLAVGAVTINAYARNFQGVAVGLSGIALAQSSYSLLSQTAAKKESQRFWIYLRKGVLLLLAITIPGSILLALAAPFAAWLVHLSHVLPAFALCLTFYAISIPFESINCLLLRSFYALKHTVTPAFASVFNGAVAIACAWILAPRFGIYSLALGFALGQILEMIFLLLFLPGRARKAMEVPVSV